MADPVALRLASFSGRATVCGRRASPSDRLIIAIQRMIACRRAEVGASGWEIGTGLAYALRESGELTAEMLDGLIGQLIYYRNHCLPEQAASAPSVGPVAAGAGSVHAGDPAQAVPA